MERLWPLEPLLEHLDTWDRQYGPFSGRMNRWNTEGLRDVEADHVAVYLGLHPSAIWHDWFAGALPRQGNCDGCDGQLGPNGGCRRCAKRNRRLRAKARANA